MIRGDPRFEATVEGAEALDLAVGRVPAWRIRIDIDGLGARDRVHVWYGRSGFLQSDVHLESEATDTNGNPIAQVIFEESEELVALSLNRGRFAAPQGAARQPASVSAPAAAASARGYSRITR